MKIGFIFFTCALFAFSSCKRSSKDILNDSRSAGRYLGKGLRSLGGKQTESRQFHSVNEMGKVEEEEYVPINDEDLYQKIVLGDQQTLENLHPTSSVPASQTAPGEMGSAIPGIEKFSSAAEMHLNHIFQNVHFDTNSDILVDQKSLETMEKASQYLKENPSFYIFVEGHCDKRGSRAYNLALGTRRSNTIRVMLIKSGVHPDHIFTISYGKEHPLIPGDSQEILRQNRRGEFKLYEYHA